MSASLTVAASIASSEQLPCAWRPAFISFTQARITSTPMAMLYFLSVECSFTSSVSRRKKAKFSKGDSAAYSPIRIRVVGADFLASDS